MGSQQRGISVCKKIVSDSVALQLERNEKIFRYTYGKSHISGTLSYGPTILIPSRSQGP